MAFINSHPDIAKIAIALSGHTIFFRQYTAFTATIDNPGSGDSANIMISNNGDGDFTIFSLQYTILIVESIAASYIDVVMSGKYSITQITFVMY